MLDNVDIRNFIEDYQGKTVHLTNGTSIRFTKAAAETALHLLSHRLPADEGGYHDVFPSKARLATKAGITERAIQMRLVQLERLGLVRRVSRFREDGRSTSNYFMFAIPNVLKKPQRLAVNKKHSIAQPPKSSPQNPCGSVRSLSQERFLPPADQPFALKGDVDLKRSTTSDPTYLDQSNHNIVTPAFPQSHQGANAASPAAPAEVVVFCNRFQATPKQKEALLRAVQYYGLETVKEALDTFRKWSDEGLLVFDPEKLDDFTKKIVSGAIGAWQHSPGMYVKEGKATDPNFDVIAVQNPVVNEGETPHIFPRWPCEGRGAAVSAQCPKDKYEAIGRWMDFAYSEEGYILDNFGIEGKQYTIVNDKIMPADIMYKEEPDGLTLDQYMRRHFRPKNAPGPYMNGGQRHYLHEDALNKDKNYPYMDQAAEAWGNGDPSGTMPLLYLTSEEAKVIDNYSGMTTYVSDMLNKFISGEESLDNFDKYVEEAKRLGADKVVSIYQSALDRYYAR